MRPIARFIVIMYVIRGSMMSVRSSVYDYAEENGRTYHRFKEGRKVSLRTVKSPWLTFIEYIMPNDEVSVTDMAFLNDDLT